ncbi:hypothetical protein Tsubulata_013843 [Turnera subulata]|uniref:PB1 domain-containing protein n=1 Tax=Turnera subulata TaxID=218843 RepID=A0A9Q0G641_9ROSI|nr:hypothetical protein Tsubulata_013843 [Turnera subulata]
MERQKSGKNKKGQTDDGSVKKNKGNSPKAYDKDTLVFINMAQELKEEGNKLFQRRDLEGAMLKYEKAIKLLPPNHIDISYLRSNMAACYMQMGRSELPKAINECNLALEVTPKYSKALLKRARCYESLNKLDLALKDVSEVLKIEPNNVMALEVSEKVTRLLEGKGLRVNDTVIELPPDYVEPPNASALANMVKDKLRKKKSKQVVEQKAADEIEKKIDRVIEEDKKVVKEKISKKKEEHKKTVKLVFAEDIRCAQFPPNCSLFQLREIIHDRFPSLGAVLIKYRDQEGDLVTVTTDEELKAAEASAGSQGSFRLYLIEDKTKRRLRGRQSFSSKSGKINKGKIIENKSCCIDSWIVEFAKVFKNHVGCESDGYMDLHELGMKVYSEAMEDTVTSEEAQDLFETAAGKFQEMAALALFNWGNIHMSRARKTVYFSEDASKELVLERIKTAYEWARKEYSKAGQRYEESLKIKPDFYEGRLAMGQQQFEQAKLSWYYALGNNTDLKTWRSEEVLKLYNSAEDNMEKGTEMWEELEAQCLKKFSSSTKDKSNSQLNGLFEDIPEEEAAEQARDIRSRINILWGTILYERSIMEFKLGLPTWKECLDVAVEKFELAGASPTDIAVLLKNHISSDSSMEGLGFRIDEIVQAWNDMNDAKRSQTGIPSFRLEPLLRRRVAKLYHALEVV